MIHSSKSYIQQEVLMTRLTFFAATLAIGGLIAVVFPANAQSAPSTTAAAQAPHAMAGQATGMAMSDAQMMAMHEKMMTEMKASDANLDAVIAKMNTAKGAAKVDAAAEALTAMVAQYKAMRAGMMQMQGQMIMQMHGSAAMPMGAR
jgi:hypothetical protein